MFGVAIRKSFEPPAMTTSIGAFHWTICFHKVTFSNSGKALFLALWVFNVLSPLIKARPIKAKPGVCRTEYDRVVSYHPPGGLLCLLTNKNSLSVLKEFKVDSSGYCGVGGRRRAASVVDVVVVDVGGGHPQSGWCYGLIQ